MGPLSLGSEPRAVRNMPDPAMIPDEVREIFAALTGEFEDASVLAAGAQCVWNPAEANQAADKIKKALCRIERQLDRLQEALE